jgi:uridine kinase
MDGNTQQRHPITIAIAGGTGSGKTTIARAIMERVGDTIAYLPHDAYYKDLNDVPRSDTGLINFDHPEALETSLMGEHITRLQSWRRVEIPIYDYVLYRRTDDVQVIEPQPIIMVEGILVLAEAALRPFFDVKLYVDADPDIRFIRRLRRDILERGRTVESVIAQYTATVRPMHLEFVEPSKRYADVIIPEGGSNWVAIDMVSDRIRALLRHVITPLPNNANRQE